ncbi:MAG: hypothetical protein D6702_09565 [Planctomycetota bacterium]|nr:MAG: hypothetical protein D6702_09565 [Planctomycetota bacterium]
MWCLTRWGFFEARAAADGGGVLLAGRRRHLQALVRAFPAAAAGTLGPAGGGWILRLDRADWVRLAAALAAAVDDRDTRTALRESGFCGPEDYQTLGEVRRRLVRRPVSGRA